MNFVYDTPKDVKIIVVADFFPEQVLGGAELTLYSILEECPAPFVKINSSHVTRDFIEKNKDKYWLIGNCANLSQECLITLVADKIKYSKIECDYFYCKFRSSHLHKIQTGHSCDCNQTQHGKFVYGFYKHAQNVFFMSSGQMNEYKRLFTPMSNWAERLHVQGSSFSDTTLNALTQLRTNKQNDNGKWAVLKGGSWIKAEKETALYCANMNKPFELIGGLQPDLFLQELSKFKGLVFHPAGFDTAPRLVIEAACLGLELDLNENVQIKDEEWLKKTPGDLVDYLKSQRSYIWGIITL